MSGLRAQYYKETRELLPWWLGGMVAVVAGGFVIRESHDFARALATLAFAAAACGLGGLAIGQEYSHRTIGGLLAQPARRAAVLGIKLVVLAVSLLSLGAVAYLMLRGGPLDSKYASYELMQSILAVIGCGFFLAPWLSMVGRGALAGMVFSIALPVATFVALALLADKLEWFGVHVHTIISLKLFLTIVLCTLWAIGGVLTWTTFLRLQSLDGSHGHVGLPSWLTRRPMAVAQTDVRKRNPVWLMVGKELRLQQLAFAISATYVLVWAGFLLSDLPRALEPLAVIYGIVIPVVIGGVASAEERHLGTASWQTLLPMASAWQWIIKAGVALLLTAVLVPGMPFLLSRLGGPHVDIESGLVMAAVCGCVVALYISSVTGSGIRAILTAGLAMIVMFSVGNGLWGALVVPTMQRLYRMAQSAPFTVTTRQIAPWAHWLDWLQFYGVVVGGTALLLRFGAANHRSGEVSRRRIGWQMGWVFGYLTGIGLISSFALQVVWAAYRTPDRTLAFRSTPPAVYSLRLQPAGAAAGEVRCLVVLGSFGEQRGQAFRCPSVPSGDFRLLVTPRPNAAPSTYFGIMPLSIEGRDLTTIPVRTAPDVAINGVVVVEGGRALPAGLQVVTPETTYEFAGQSITAAAVPPAMVGADGSFRLPGRAGPLVIRLQNLPADWTVKFVFNRGTDDSNPSTIWGVAVTAATGTVAGTVLTADRRPAHDALVIVFPSGDAHVFRPLRWSIRTTLVGAGGRYSVAGLLPGAYRVAFVHGVADGAWDSPDMITALQADSIPITISVGTRATIDGTIPGGRPR